MKKQAEIEILDSAIKSLGASSYLAPWLTEVRAEVQSNLASDYYPTISLADTARRCDEMFAAATKQRADIKAQADKYAETTINGARDRANAIISRAAITMREALNTLTDK